ncbi:outer membrane protein assembly factor BamB [Acinetobacter pollinis]|uniref:outer membrane protein assembly factor BamB n=1 Tax=Acinetobacter pollinis TaxID=2605270 RepID=UPI0018A2D755|nr:outer membrane protein assembly factor BamB [Acinetobacter pollinis]MBF7690162.1 outer membrane protein assembly factor BamB [Acinetobacter pollinis]MBF7693098.1 outer membrane protein assembly factor BamB [Acinetobacter pollinis]MBF7697597.1 outer membrane protein assembly factor BamB [Acinetobacter pollinis]MBF7699738.1 outer membrane protein assembly factor BamB [Acinetobacter pollinis]
MNKRFKIPFVLTLVAAALVGCSSNKPKVEKIKPNPLPKLVQAKTLHQVFSEHVSATNKYDPLRLQIAVDNGTLFLIDPNKDTVEAFQGNKRLWATRIAKHETLSAGAVADSGMVIVGNQKGQLFALDQATGTVKWTSQLSGPIITPSHIQQGRVITVTNDGNVYAHDISSGQQLWTYRLPTVTLSLRGQAAPTQLDPNTVLIGTANAYVYGIDVVSGIPRLQRRVSVAEGSTDVQRLNDIDGDPVMMGQFMVTTSYQGQVTVTDLQQQQVVWSDNVSSNKRPQVTQDAVYVTTMDGKIIAYGLLTGEKLWENDQLLHRNLSNPVLFGSDLVVGDFDGALSLIDPSTGKIIGRSMTKGDVTSLRVIDNQLYVSTQKGALSVWQNR